MTINPYSVAVTTSAKKILAPGSGKRNVIISNTGANTIFITSAEGDAATLGLAIGAGSSYRFKGAAARWVRTSASTSTATVTDGTSITAETAPFALETINLRLTGAATAATLKDFALVGVAGKIVDVRAYALTAPVGSAMNLDVNLNGTTLFTTQANRPIIADGANVSSTTLPDVVDVVAGDRLSFDVDQIGSGTAGSNVMVAITIKRASVA